MCRAGGCTAVGEDEQRLCPADIGLEGQGVPAVVLQPLDRPFRAEFCGLSGIVGNRELNERHIRRVDRELRFQYNAVLIRTRRDL